MSFDHSSPLSRRAIPVLFLTAVVCAALALVFRVADHTFATVFGVGALLMLIGGVLLAGIATSRVE